MSNFVWFQQGLKATVLRISSVANRWGHFHTYSLQVHQNRFSQCLRPWDEGFLCMCLGNAVRRKVNAWAFLLPFAKDQETGRNKSVAPFLSHDKNPPVLPIKSGGAVALVPRRRSKAFLVCQSRAPQQRTSLSFSQLFPHPAEPKAMHPLCPQLFHLYWYGTLLRLEEIRLLII